MKKSFSWENPFVDRFRHLPRLFLVQDRFKWTKPKRNERRKAKTFLRNFTFFRKDTIHWFSHTSFFKKLAIFCQFFAPPPLQTNIPKKFTINNDFFDTLSKVANKCKMSEWARTSLSALRVILSSLFLDLQPTALDAWEGREFFHSWRKVWPSSQGLPRELSSTRPTRASTKGKVTR